MKTPFSWSTPTRSLVTLPGGAGKNLDHITVPQFSGFVLIAVMFAPYQFPP